MSLQPKRESRAFPGETGAAEESRTLDLYLGKVSLYQLSYCRAKPSGIIGASGTMSTLSHHLVVIEGSSGEMREAGAEPKIPGPPDVLTPLQRRQDREASITADCEFSSIYRVDRSIA